MRHRVPSSEVIEAFGLTGGPVLLPGGQGAAVQIGSVVLKQVDDPVQGHWLQDFTNRIAPSKSRVATPRSTDRGDWVADGWIASEMVEGLRPAAPNWDLVIETGKQFIDAAKLIEDLDTSPLGQRQDRWATADHCAWREARPNLPMLAQALFDDIMANVPDGSTERPTVVHGDLAGNTHVAPAGTPVILDISPYLRPTWWQRSIVIVDVMLFAPASATGTKLAARSDTSADQLRRALAFRLAAEPPTLLADHRCMSVYSKVSRALSTLAS